MKILVKTIAKKPTYTISKMYIDGVYFCDTLEPPVRTLIDFNKDGDYDDPGEGKIKGDTAISAGTYKVALNIISPKYQLREPYKSVCGGKVPRLLNVYGFDGILIHIGNSSKDTEGCILIGENKVVGQVINSTETWKKFYNKIKEQNNLTVTIER